jgi:enamine deaminase RidA (YjgF/YER057c/UK114 family)
VSGKFCQINTILTLITWQTNIQQLSINRIMMENKSIRVIQRREYREIHIQLIPLPGETSQLFSEKIAEILKNNNAKVIRITFFGNLSEKDNSIKWLGNYLTGIDFPITWIEGKNCTGSFINGVYIFAVSGINIKRLYENKNVIASFFQTKEADFCYLGGLYSDPELTPAQQTESILNLAETILNQVELSYENTIRTWFYLDNILDWYNDFNKARTAFFLKHDIFNKLVPASTGISGKNDTGSKICLELTAIKPKDAAYSVNKVRSPLQCSAENYGSSFSRAIRFSDSEFSIMTISGTASIDPDGKTAHQKDLPKQIELSFAVVKAILDSQDFKFSDIIRAYAYCSDKSFSKAFYEFIESHFPDRFAFICAENKICRDDLLFEIEMDVVKKNI